MHIVVFQVICKQWQVKGLILWLPFRWLSLVRVFRWEWVVTTKELLQISEAADSKWNVDFADQPKKHATNIGKIIHWDLEQILQSAHADYDKNKISLKSDKTTFNGIENQKKTKCTRNCQSTKAISQHSDPRRERAAAYTAKTQWKTRQTGKVWCAQLMGTLKATWALYITLCKRFPCAIY